MKMFMFVLFTYVFSASAFAAPSCRIKLTDSLNRFTAEISVQRTQIADEEVFTVINQGDQIQVHFRNDMMTDVNAGVPRSNQSEIVARFDDVTHSLLNGKVVSQDNQLTWEALDTSDCTIVGASLIQFFVFEWFYYG